jgi:hypothetical protein
MTFKALSSNAELLEYLRHLVDELRRSDESEFADVVLTASFFASGSPSEFLHEARTALGKVRLNCVGKLSSKEFEKLSSVIAQIDVAFRQIGGA